MRLYRPFPLALSIIFSIAFLSLAPLAHAESVVWNTTFCPQKSYFRGLRYPDGSKPGLAGYGEWVQFSDTQDQT
ncbi:MAG: hypothetical protein K8F92_16445 [Hyphomicrobium sp.]|uniref:hypothetical protein n=1 Tax=Hyphomicrobium sp. TaxID=82 RepID=UPI0013253A3F|nr:hypothetical protein [Hyphomicrobium sp.]KAB2937847.1 MAG: hypothetical protein F9K20_19530 [Hyphomicrobium sp.]MBZ0211222.1 hypothetical protein [Hyphomicrobium sp.]